MADDYFTRENENNDDMYAKRTASSREPRSPAEHQIGVGVMGSVIIISPEDPQYSKYLKSKVSGETESEEQPYSDDRNEINAANLTGLKLIHFKLLRSIGRFLKYLLHFNMHGGTGENTNFVHGVIDFFAGSLGGMMQVYVSQPLDTVKVKQQAFPELYNGMVDCFMKTYRKDGFFQGLYAGSIPAVIANVAENSVLFCAYGGCQKAVAYAVGKEDILKLTILENAFAGFFAAFFSTFALCPTELIKCKLQALREMKNYIEPGTTTPKTPWSLTKYIYEREGIPGFFRGLSSTFIREMPGYFCFFGGYELTREFLRKPEETKDEIGALKTMAAGAVGGVALWTSVFPADVIKSRIQVKNLRRGMFSVGLEIIRKEGVFALYTGLLPSILRTIPATATLFVVYEYTKKALNNSLML